MALVGRVVKSPVGSGLAFRASTYCADKVMEIGEAKQNPLMADSGLGGYLGNPLLGGSSSSGLGFGLGMFGGGFHMNPMAGLLNNGMGMMSSLGVADGLKDLVGLMYDLKSMANPLPGLFGNGLGSGLLPGAGGFLGAEALGAGAVQGGFRGMNTVASGLDSLIDLVYGLESMMKPPAMIDGGMGIEMGMPGLLESGLGLDSSLLTGADGPVGAFGGWLGGAAQGGFPGMNTLANGPGSLINLIYGLKSMMNPLAMMGGGMGMPGLLRSGRGRGSSLLPSAGGLLGRRRGSRRRRRSYPVPAVS